MSFEPFDAEKIVSMVTIREHTKTTDVSHVTDEIMSLYRSAAIESAEKHTGLLLSGRRTITENIATRGHQHKFRKNVKITLSNPTSDGIVTLTSPHNGHKGAVIHVKPGQKRVTVPILCEALDINCCDPCGMAPGENMGVTAMYRTGYESPEEIPSGIIYGCLKFIAWAVMNAGDTIKTVTNVEARNSYGIVGTNDGAWASGAIEHWRMYRCD